MVTFPIKEVRANRVAIVTDDAGFLVTEIIFGCAEDDGIEFLDIDSIVGICYGYSASTIVLCGPLAFDGMGELMAKLVTDHNIFIYTGGQCHGHG